MSATLDAVIARLEGVASRLEASEVSSGISQQATSPYHLLLRRFTLSSCNEQARLGEFPARQPTSEGRQSQSDLPSKPSPAGSGSLQAWDSSISPLVSSFKAASEGLGNEVSGSVR